MQTTLSRSLLLCATLTVACAGDDDPAGQESSEGGPSTTDPSTTGPSTTDPATTDPATTDPATTDPATTDAESSGADTTAESSTGAVDDGIYGALIRGPLFTDDLGEAQAYHDQIASAGMAPSMALGDFGHDVLLGTTLLGTPENEFLAIDQWSSLDGATTLYTDPMFQRGFAGLFAEPVAPALFERRDDWYGWGDLDAADGAPEHFYAVVRGRLAGEPDEIHPMHDAVAMGGEAMVTAAGDVAHVVWLGVQDPREFWAVDVWTDDAAIEAVYTNPDFQAGLLPLFEGTPSIAVYRSTDWVQW